MNRLLTTFSVLPDVQRYIKKTAVFLFGFIVCVLFIRLFLFEPGRIDGQSMEPTLRDDDLFFVNRIAYFFHPPERFDVVQFLDPTKKGSLLVKRIVALPGETLIFKHNTIYIRASDGEEQPILEGYLPSQTVTSLQPGQEFEIFIPENSYFVLGDNRVLSVDSRVFGPVHRKFINGKIFLVSWP